jgi:hypothetical protein
MKTPQKINTYEDDNLKPKEKRERSKGTGKNLSANEMQKQEGLLQN